MKNFRLNLIFRLIFLSVSIFLLFYIYYNTELTATLLILSLINIYQIYAIIRFVDITNKELSRFLLSIKHSDFSQTFPRGRLGKSFNELSNSFNEVIQMFRETRHQKEEHYRYLQTVIQHVGVGLISFNKEGKVEFINNAAKKLLKVPYLTNIKNLNKVSSKLGDNLSELTTGKKSTIKLVDDNELIQLFVYATEFKLRDTNYKLVAMQNIQSELEEKEMEAWQKLIRVLTHEIMNSVTPISSLASTVKNMLTNGENQKKEIELETIDDIRTAVNTIEKRSEGLIHFVENYRNLTRIPKPNFQIFPIKDLFNQVEFLMKSELYGRQVEFINRVEPETLELTADSELIEQVIINLLLNAVHFLRNVKEPRIYLIAKLDERGKIVIRVIDNGPGIKEEDIEKIFIPFYSTKKDGSGIGLSLSRQIMRAHGGNIRVTSLPNKETIFTLRF